MKRILIKIIGAAALFSLAIPGFGQGRISLDNYGSFPDNPLITYSGPYAGAHAGMGVQNGFGGNWTIGFYYALGDVTGSIANDPTTQSDPSTLGGGIAFATGATGDTTTFNQSPGYFTTSSDAVINGYTSGLITLEIVVYNGSSYGSSTMRAHSSAFTMTPATGIDSAPLVGHSMPAFSVIVTPEPTVFAFAGAGAALLLISRHKRRV